MEHKLMELIPQDVWQLIAKRLSQKDRSAARAVSRFFFNKMTPEWDHYSRECRKIRTIVAGFGHSLLLTETGELFGCGHNYYGQLGLGHTENQVSWIPLRANTHIHAIAAGRNHSLLVTETGELFGCGDNEYGQLGLGDTQHQASWIRLTDKTPIRAIAAGAYHSLLLTETGELFGCGLNQYGQLGGLGHTQHQASWIPLSDKAKIRSIVAGRRHSLLVTETGELFGCGYNISSELGLRHTQNQATWVKLNPFPKSHSLSFDELCHQRHLAFQSASL